MRKIFLLLLLTACGLVAGAQRVYYIYMQSDGGMPFYVKMGDAVITASPVGHVLLPELVDSAYTLRIGMPGSEVPEARFTIKINGADKGYMLRKGDGGFQLFDLQHLTIIKPEVAKETGLRYEKRTDAFSSLLAKASGDPGLLMVAVAVVQPAVTEPEPAVVRKTETETPKEPVTLEVARAGADLSAVALAKAESEKEKGKGKEEEEKVEEVKGKEIEEKNTEKEAEERKEEPVAVTTEQVASKIETGTGKVAEGVDSVSVREEEAPFVRSRISKYSESSTSEGFGLVYFDENGSSTDTVRLLIPNPKIIFNKPEEKKDDPGFLQFSDTVMKEKESESESESGKEIEKEKESESESGKEIEKEKGKEKGKEELGEKGEAGTVTKGEEKKEVAVDGNKEPVIAEQKKVLPEMGEKKTDPMQDANKDSLLKAEPGKEGVAKPGEGGILPPPVACRSHASENDFFKLRKTMVTHDSDEAMVAEAKKVFKGKCFTTEQVRNLGALFLTSAGKYLFYEAAFMHVSDRDQFPRLGSDIRDEYYSRRFKALIGE